MYKVDCPFYVLGTYSHWSFPKYETDQNRIVCSRIYIHILISYKYNNEFCKYVELSREFTTRGLLQEYEALGGAPGGAPGVQRTVLYFQVSRILV